MEIKAVFTGIITGCVLAIVPAMTLYNAGVEKGRLLEQQRFQKEAVKAKVGKWGSDEEGAPVFMWTVCTALGVRQ